MLLYTYIQNDQMMPKKLGIISELGVCSCVFVIAMLVSARCSTLCDALIIFTLTQLH